MKNNAKIKKDINEEISKEENEEITKETIITEEDFIEVVGDSEEVINEVEEEVK